MININEAREFYDKITHDKGLREDLRKKPYKYAKELGHDLDKGITIAVKTNRKDVTYIIFPGADFILDDKALNIVSAGVKAGTAGSAGSASTASTVGSVCASFSTAGSVGSISTVGSATG